MKSTSRNFMITEPSKKLTIGAAIDEIAKAGYGGNIYQAAKGIGIEYQCIQAYRGKSVRASKASAKVAAGPNHVNMARILSAYVRHCGGIASLDVDTNGRVLVAVYGG